jgi:hypothetical protein
VKLVEKRESGIGVERGHAVVGSACPQEVKGFCRQLWAECIERLTIEMRGGGGVTAIVELRTQRRRVFRKALEVTSRPIEFSRSPKSFDAGAELIERS